MMSHISRGISFFITLIKTKPSTNAPIPLKRIRDDFVIGVPVHRKISAISPYTPAFVFHGMPQAPQADLRWESLPNMRWIRWQARCSDQLQARS